MIYETLAENIKYFRKLKSLSQLDLAALAKINGKTITRAESGKQGIKLEVIKKISDALDVEFYKLFIPRKTSFEGETDTKNIITAKLELFSQDRLIAINKLIDVVGEIK